ncbi:MAG: TRAP transporter small permease subunit [Brachymonas sp.]|nr:TRAP transporter small permease subunit [Brachymonas sp.]
MILLGAALVVVVFGNVILHAFDKDIAWTTEFGELVMVWITFLGVTAAVQRNLHMAVSELIDLLPEPGPRRIADGIIQLAIGALLALLTWKGAIAADSGWQSELTVTGWPVAIQYFALPVCSAIALIFVAWDLLQIARGVPRQQRYGSSSVATA